MKRRSFLTVSAAGALASAAPYGVEAAAARKTSAPAGVKIAGRTLAALRDEHRSWLFDDFLPFMDKYVIDHELGGFMCAVDRDGTQINSGKRGWYEGRGIWTYSFLYNNVARERKYLDVASKSVNFVLKYKPEGDRIWPENYARDGANDGKPDERLYGDLFIALGLQEYAKAVKDERYWNIAKETILKDVRIFDRPDYAGKGERVQGVWMCLINTIGAALEFKPDAELKKIQDRAIDAVFTRHFVPDFRLNCETLNHDFSMPAESANTAMFGHSIETFWMIMFEAVRRGDKRMFDTAAERFRRHVEVAWDDVYGGLYEESPNVDENTVTLRKVLWLQGEALVGSLFIYEHTGAPWAKEMYERLWTYVTDKFPLKKYGHPLWLEWGDRKATYTEHTARCEHFHHPRHLMLNLLALDRMIKRGGKPSGIFG